MSELLPWKRQVVVIWLTQFLSIMGFCIGLPFAAYHIQDLGVSGDDVVWWNTAFAVAAPMCFFFSAPFWGHMADRFGRKKMLVRANICAALVLLGMAWSPNVYWLIVFRVGQGLFTGVMPAAQTLMAVSTPHHRQGMALGSLAAAVAAGVAVGGGLGGRVAEIYGYETTFYCGAAIQALATVLIIFGATERHDAKTAKQTRNDSRGAIRLAVPVLLLIALGSLMSNADTATFPLLIQELNGGLEGAARIVGDVNALAGISFALGGMLCGWCADRFGVYRMLVSTSLMAAFGSIVMCYIYELGLSYIYMIVLLLSFIMAGIDPVLQVLLSKETPTDLRGRVFGFAATARSVGWLFGPMLGSAVAVQSDFAQVYWLRLVCVVLMLPIMVWAYRWGRQRLQAAGES